MYLLYIHEFKLSIKTYADQLQEKRLCGVSARVGLRHMLKLVNFLTQASVAIRQLKAP